VLTTLAAIAIGLIAAMAARLIAGRLAGLSMTAICGATIAYMLPPAFSFRVSEPRDLAALALYGAVGLVLASPPPRRARPLVFPVASPAAAAPETALNLVAGSVVGDRIRQAGVTLHAGGSLAGPPEMLSRMLSDVIESALDDTTIAHIAIYSARSPERQALFVAAYREWPRSAVTIGKRADSCESLHFAGWPSHSRASRFDNPYGCVYQVELDR
jgi:hypothetical protein